jgi:hypothetical protein
VLPLIPESLCITQIARPIGSEQPHAYMVALAVEGGLDHLSHLPVTVLFL